MRLAFAIILHRWRCWRCRRTVRAEMRRTRHSPGFAYRRWLSNRTKL